jgi:pimeloyl-ACP methyl ester carboxylesterase
VSIIYQIGILIFSLFTTLVLYQKLATVIDDYRYPPPGKLVDIGGYKLHINTSGQGNLSVVCDAGLSGTSLGWTLVQTEVSKFTRVCSYDRAGYSWSDPSPLKRTSANIATELYALLKKNDIPAPYLLVGHSFGGANVLLFAHLYPQETLGVILVDSVHEDMLSDSPPPPYAFFDSPTIQWILSLIGFKRLKGPSKEIEAMFNPLPPKIQAAYIAQMNKTRYEETVNQEMDALNESLSQVGERTIFLHCPLTVITAGIIFNNEEGKRWKQLQNKLLSKSKYAKQIVAENSDHMINHHQPEIIVNAIREMIDHHSF